MFSPVGRSAVLVVGLGNPGLKFEQTRHNVGFRVVEALVGDGTWKENAKHKAVVSRGTILDVGAHFLKPQTFMNLSGEAVQSYVSYHKIPPTHIIVVHDDADLPFGEVRGKFGGGTAGHNGLQSVVDVLGTPDFHRVRIGIGRDPNPQIPLDVFVLNPWTEPERAALPEVIGHATHTVEEIVARMNASL